MWNIVTSLWGKNKVWGVAAAVALLLFNGVMYIYTAIQDEVTYHEWAGSYSVHRHDEMRVEYSNGDVRVFWKSYPKVPRCNFKEIYTLHRPVGEPIGVQTAYHSVPMAAPYRRDPLPTDYNIKRANHWGQWIHVGRLDPGVYQLSVEYHYDCGIYNFIYPDWVADQRITFVVEDDNEK